MLTDSFPGPSGLSDSIETGKDIGALIAHTGGIPRAGLLWQGTGNLVTSRSDMRVNVAAFKAALVRLGAVRLLANDDVDQSPDLTIPSANSRIDVLYVKVGENAIASGETDGPFFGILEGVANAIPTKPVLSIEGALELATIQIPSTATATNSVGVTITQTAQRTSVAAGALLPDPVTSSPGNVTVPTAGTSAWTDSGWAGFTLTLPEACWVDLDLEAWIAVTGSGNDVRADVRVQGATTIAAQSAGWGSVAYGGVGTTKATARKVVKLNAGANQIRLSVFRTVSSSGTFQLSQSTVTATPLRPA